MPSGCSPARYGCWISACSGISDYLKSLIGSQHTAKDFRTWNATVMAAASLAADGRDATTKTARKRAMDGAVLDLLHDDRGSPAVEHSLPRAA